MVYAREDVTVCDSHRWEDDAIKDIPFAGETIPQGMPICTVFGAGRTRTDCLQKLVRKARQVHHTLVAPQAVSPGRVSLRPVAEGGEIYG